MTKLKLTGDSNILKKTASSISKKDLSLAVKEAAKCPEDSCGSAEPKKYVALLSQSGTDDPIATILENTLGEIPVWTRSGVGVYNCTITSGLFISNKTLCFAMVGPVWGSGNVQFNFGQSSVNICELRIYYSGISAVDVGNFPGNDVCIEIRVYP